jgi:uncharacterized protein YecE (DUF72 family)
MVDVRQRATIRVGLAGWDYPDWDGIVYPRERSRGFDKLRWIARFVESIEINSSFYRPVRPAVTETSVRRTESAAGFRFTAKAHRSWTHEIARELAGRAEEVFVVQNNHFRGQALANALQLRHLFEGEKPRSPQGLVETFPDLATDVQAERETLF